MRKILGLFLGIGAITASVVAASSCSSFLKKDSDNYLAIASVDVDVDEETGTTIVTIKYNDNKRQPTIIEIPKGEKGETGVGITGFEVDDKSDPLNNIIIVHLTDKDESFKLAKGTKITNIESFEVDPEEDPDHAGQICIEITVSDSEEPHVFYVEKGKDAPVITSVELANNEDTGDLELVLHLSDDSTIKCNAMQIRGEDGNGIQDIIAKEDDNGYHITFVFTKEDEEGNKEKTLDFSKPSQPNTWRSGVGSPEGKYGEKDKVIAGDFYFDTQGCNIWEYDGSKWNLVATLNDRSKQYTVTFDLNDEFDGGPSASLPGPDEYKIPSGLYFAATPYEIPIPTRGDDYEFLGWSTKSKKTVVNGYFTDLTPVYTNLTLYAIWNCLVD